MTQPPLFDPDDLLRREVIAQPWAGPAPLSYTDGYYTPAQFEAAFKRWVAEHGLLGAAFDSHMWHPWQAGTTRLGIHRLEMLSANLPDERGGLIFQSNCEPCRWHAISARENEVVEAWYDHSMPNWRGLPIFPTNLSHTDTPRQKAAARNWIHNNYPPDALVEGAPILTRRSAHGTRHVPGRSPLGGYDICVGIEAHS